MPGNFARGEEGSLPVKNIRVFLFTVFPSQFAFFVHESQNEATANVRTAAEWRTLLSEAGYADIEITESRARRPWYPCALRIKATAGSV